MSLGAAIGGLTVGVLATVAAPILLALAGSASGSENTCDISVAGSVGGLSSTQVAHAGDVITAGQRLGVPALGMVVALATALQESRLTVYANDGRGGDLASDQRGIAASLALPHEAVGTDHGSLGIFQQQWPWWGSMRQLMDPEESATLFYRALLRVPGWQGMSVTVAAQTVQRSAYPDAYADDEPLARALVAQLAGEGCSEPGGGGVHFPLPANSGYVDQHNFGRSGSHWASFHTGTDLSIACGTPVLAATDGVVHIRTDQPWAGPWLVQVSTGPGRLTTWYAHMQRVTAHEGQRVVGGQVIGAVGAMGNATGCHLHFEVHPRGGAIYEDPVDPSDWLITMSQ